MDQETAAHGATENRTAIRLTISAPTDLLDELSGCLFSAGASGLIEDGDGFTVYPADTEELARLKAAILQFCASHSHIGSANAVTLRVETVKDTWSQAWQSALGPERITPRFTLRPTHASEVPAGENTIWFEPSSSFGAGEHATTRLAAGWIESYLELRARLHCFDVGTGTGVLAFVAALSGAEQVLAVDIDEIAVRAAVRNAELNDLEPLVTVGQGSADITDETFDLVIANINTPVLLNLCGALSRRVAPGGKLLLTGLLIEDAPELEKSFVARGLRKEALDSSGQWGLLIFSRS